MVHGIVNVFKAFEESFILVFSVIYASRNLTSHVEQKITVKVEAILGISFETT